MEYQKIQLIYIFLFVFIFLLKYLLTYKKGIHVFLTLDRAKDKKQRFFEILPIVLFSILIFSALNEAFSWGALKFLFAGFCFPEVVTYSGIILGGISFVFLITGYYQLGDNWRMGSGEEEKKKLIVSGIFSATRNPVYLYFIIFSFSLFLMTGKLIYAFLFFLIIWSMHKLISYEEKSLEKAFKEKYLEYKKRVPRYL